MDANFASGSVSIYPVRDDGSLGPASDFVQHAGSCVFDPTNRFVFVPDLGLDRVVSYRYDAGSGTLAKHATTAMKPGAGPRHIVFGRDGRSRGA